VAAATCAAPPALPPAAPLPVEVSTHPLHDALPIFTDTLPEESTDSVKSVGPPAAVVASAPSRATTWPPCRNRNTWLPLSESIRRASNHTSELQSGEKLAFEILVPLKELSFNNAAAK